MIKYVVCLVRKDAKKKKAGVCGGGVESTQLGAAVLADAAREASVRGCI